MPTTGLMKGNQIGVYVDDTLVACATDGSFSGSNEEIDATCKDNDGAKQTLLGQQSGSFNLALLSKFDATYGIEDLRTAWSTKATVTVKLSTGVIGDKAFSADCLITSFEETAPLNGVATCSCTFTTTGPITLITEA